MNCIHVYLNSSLWLLTDYFIFICISLILQWNLIVWTTFKIWPQTDFSVKFPQCFSRKKYSNQLLTVYDDQRWTNDFHNSSTWKKLFWHNQTNDNDLGALYNISFMISSSVCSLNIQLIFYCSNWNTHYLIKVVQANVNDN